MTVKKKVVGESLIHGKIDLSSRLSRVREAISQLPTDEGDNMFTVEESSQSAGSGEVAKKVVRKKTVVKKAAAKPAEVATLAVVCKPLKLTPRAARRALRNAKVKNPGRWSWPRGAVPASVTKLLKAAAAS